MSSTKIDPREEVKITSERREYIEENPDQPIDKLQEETRLSKYVIETIIEVKKHNYYRGHKYDQLTSDMKNYLVTAEFDSFSQLKRNFNRIFHDSHLTPITQKTLKKYRKKLRAQGE